jgi:hypothetical protein
VLREMKVESRDNNHKEDNDKDEIISGREKEK